MTFHLFGNILTFYGVAANNRGENQGNITTLQKLLWKGETHTVVSSEAIRWAIRYYWQKAEVSVELWVGGEISVYAKLIVYLVPKFIRMSSTALTKAE